MRPTVPSASFRIVEIDIKHQRKILTSFFRGGHGLFGLILAAPLHQSWINCNCNCNWVELITYFRVIVILIVMETFCSRVCVILICDKNRPIYNYFCFQQLHRIREKAEKQNHFTPSMWPTTIPQSLSGTVAILRGPGWAMAPPYFCLAPRLAPPSCFS